MRIGMSLTFSKEVENTFIMMGHLLWVLKGDRVYLLRKNRKGLWVKRKGYMRYHENYMKSEGKWQCLL
jgi:hypothetical protein